MSRKNKKQEKETTIENYYDLRQDAVDDLVEALKTGESDKEISTNIAEITGESIDAKPGSKKAEFNPYKRDFLAKIPVWLKAVFIKWWFAGCVCYFIMMGLGHNIASNLDLWFITALAYGVIVDVMVNPIFRFMESPEKEYDNYMMFPFPFKAFWTFFTNIIYYFLVMFVVNLINNAINLAVEAVGGNFIVYLGPLVFATLTTIIDMAFIGIKDGIVYGVKKAKRKKQLEAEGISADADAAFVVKTNSDTVYGEAAGEEDNSAVQPQEPITDDGQVDEVEKLRQLAESKNSENQNTEKKTTAKKNTKKK